MNNAVTMYESYCKENGAAASEIKVVIRKTGEYCLTDLGNARRFAREHFNEVRYSFERSCWYVWNGVIWTPEKTGLVYLLAKQTIEKFYQEAVSLDDVKSRKPVLDWVLKSESNFKRKKMIAYARADMAISAHQMDNDSRLIACFNETIDVDSGCLFVNQRENYITKQLYVKFDETASCYGWNCFLSALFNNEADRIEYFQELVGYLLTAKHHRDANIVVSLPNGSAAERKIIIHILKTLFGDYADRLNILEIVAGRHTSDKYADLNIRKQLVTELEEELSGILEWVIEGLKNYRYRGLTTEPEAVSA